MKTIVIMVAFSMTAVSQVNPYEEARTFKENGYTYKCEVLNPKMVRLYNVDYKWKEGSLRNKETGEPYYPKKHGEKGLYTKNDREITKLKREKTKKSWINIS